jgi:hypothetical protein
MEDVSGSSGTPDQPQKGLWVPPNIEVLANGRRREGHTLRPSEETCSGSVQQHHNGYSSPLGAASSSGETVDGQALHDAVRNTTEGLDLGDPNGIPSARGNSRLSHQSEAPRGPEFSEYCGEIVGDYILYRFK